MTNVFLKVLELSLVGSYVILFVIAVRALLHSCKTPKWSAYLLWGIVFLRLILPVVPESRFGLVPAGEQLSQGIMAEVQEKGAGQESIPGVENVRDEAGRNDDITSGAEQTPGSASQSTPESQGTAFGLNNTVQPLEVPKTSNEANKSLDREGILRVLAYLWLAGVIGIGGYHVVSYCNFKASLKGVVWVADGIYEIPGRHVSFVLGIIKPAIYVSDSLDEDTRKVVLCHERVHLQRKDYLTKPLALAVACVHWFNPLVWLAFYLMNKDCEMSCDEKVVSLLGEESKKLYSYALLDEAAKGERQRCKRENTCAVLSFGEDSIKARIKHVLHFKKAPVWLIAGTVTVIVFVAAGLLSNRKSDGLKSENTVSLEGQDKEAEDLSVYQKAPDEALKKWATAFTEKDINTLYELNNNEAINWWDIISVLKGRFSFGDSSPWPTKNDFEIEYEEGQEEATIRYWMRSSVPEVYPVEETVKVVKDGDLYYVQHLEMVSHHSVDTLAELKEAYVRKKDDINGNLERMGNKDCRWYDWTDNTGYDKEFMQSIFYHVTNNTNPEYYDAYKDPISAAKIMLHLGAGTGEVTEILHQTESQKTQGESTDGVLGEGTVVNVMYVFAEDGSSVQIPMVLAEESQGIWALSAGDFTKADRYTKGALKADTNFLAREVFETFHYNGCSAYQISDYGVYEVSADTFQCVYAMNMANGKYDYTSAFGVCYFYYPVDSRNKEDNPDTMPDSLCEVNLTTGEAYVFPFEAAQYLSDDKAHFNVNAGYVTLYSAGKGNGCYILANAGKVWKGKTTAELSDKEKDEYGAANREYILSHPCEVVALGNRYTEQTDACIDLNGDGRTEQIAIGKGEPGGWHLPYDHYVLKVDDWQEYRYASNLHNNIWAVSPDGKHIYIVLYEDGPSGDPNTTFLRYYDGKLVEAGTTSNSVHNLAMENGMIHTYDRVDLIQTDFIAVQYAFDENGNLQQLPQEVYEYGGYESQEGYKLLKEMTLYTEPGGGESFTLQPQTVFLEKVDGSMKWILLRAKNGQTGWFEVTGLYEIYGSSSREWFEGLGFAG